MYVQDGIPLFEQKYIFTAACVNDKANFTMFHPKLRWPTDDSFCRDALGKNERSHIVTTFTKNITQINLARMIIQPLRSWVTSIGHTVVARPRVRRLEVRKAGETRHQFQPIAKEWPFTPGTGGRPLCDEFEYVFPIRHPVERITSFFTEM